jgi:hypothetical protein
MLHILHTGIQYTIHNSEKVLVQRSLYCEGDNFEQENMRMTKLFSMVRSRKWKNSIGISHYYCVSNVPVDRNVHIFQNFRSRIKVLHAKRVT